MWEEEKSKTQMTKTHKLKMWKNSKTQNVTKLKHWKDDKTENVTKHKMWQN